MSMTESAIEPTPVLTEASLVVPPLLQSSSAYDDNDDVNNGTRNFDPPQPTLIEATPPLPADDIDDNGILPNLIEDDDEDKKVWGKRETVGLFFLFLFFFFLLILTVELCLRRGLVLSTKIPSVCLMSDQDQNDTGHRPNKNGFQWRNYSAPKFSSASAEFVL